MPSTITLDGDDEKLAQQLVDSGHYASVEDVVREALYRIAAEAALLDIGPDELKRLCEEGEASGMLDEDGEVTLERLRNRYRAMAAARSA